MLTRTSIVVLLLGLVACSSSHRPGGDDPKEDDAGVVTADSGPPPIVRDAGGPPIVRDSGGPPIVTDASPSTGVSVGECTRVCSAVVAACGGDDECGDECSAIVRIADASGCGPDFRNVIDCLGESPESDCVEDDEVCEDVMREFEDCIEDYCEDTRDDVCCELGGEEEPTEPDPR